MAPQQASAQQASGPVNRRPVNQGPVNQRPVAAQPEHYDYDPEDYGYEPSNHSRRPTRQVKPKKSKAPVVIVVCLLLAIGAVVAYLAFNMFFGSPVSKYSSLLDTALSRSISKSVDAYSTWYDNAEDGGKAIKEGWGIKYTLSNDVRDLLEDSVNLDGINSVGLNGVFAYDPDEEKVQVSAGLELNEDGIVSADVLSDIAEERLYITIPEITDAALYGTFDDILELADADSLNMALTNPAGEEISTEVLDALKEELTPKRYEEILVEFKNIIVEHEPLSVALEKGQEIKKDGLTTTADLYTVEYDRYDLIVLSQKMVTYLNEQEDLIEALDDVLAELGNTTSIKDSFEEVQVALDDALEEANALMEDDHEFDLIATLEIGVAKSKPTFVAAEVFGEEDNLNVHYISDTEEKKGNWFLCLNANDDEAQISVLHEAGDTNGSGDLDIEVTSAGDTIDFSIEYSDYATKDNSQQFNATLSTKALPGTEVTVQYKKQEKDLDLVLGVEFQNMDFGELAFTATEEKAGKINIPKEAYNLADEDELQEWATDAEDEIEDFLESIQDNEALFSLINSIGSSSTPSYDDEDEPDVWYDESDDSWYSEPEEPDDSWYSEPEEPEEDETKLQRPAASNNDWTSYTFEYLGEVYELPCDLDTFLNNTGLTLEDDEWTPEYIYAESCQSLTLEDENGYGCINVMLANYTNEDLPPDQCIIAGITEFYDIWGDNGDPITFPMGFQIGTEITYEELVEVLGKPDDVYEYTSDSGDYWSNTYTWCENPDRTYEKSFEIEITNGIIDRISLDCFSY